MKSFTPLRNKGLLRDAQRMDFFVRFWRIVVWMTLVFLAPSLLGNGVILRTTTFMNA